MYAVGTNIALLQIDLLYEETRQQYWEKKKPIFVFYLELQCTNQSQHLEI